MFMFMNFYVHNFLYTFKLKECKSIKENENDKNSLH